MNTRKCQFCGEPFEPVNSQQLFCDRPHYMPCPVCGEPVLRPKYALTWKPVTCSYACRKVVHEASLPIKNCEICGQPFKAKSGIATICEREHHKNCVICGKDMIVTKRMWHDKIDTCSRKCTKEKMRRFYQEKYGVDHPMQNSEVQAHHKAAMKAKYGVEHALQDPEILAATYQTNLERFGAKFACLRAECKGKIEIISSLNKRYGELLSNQGYTIQYEFPLDNKRFDIFLEGTNILMEIDPSWHHNSYTSPWNDPKEKDYHRMKSEIAIKNGYRCIHVFDWDATEKILDLVRPKIKIGARKCELVELTTEECNSFLRRYHIQGSLYKQTYRIGLKYNNELVQVMTFGAPRYDKHYDAELLRLCSKSGVSIVGGSERLFKHAIENNPQWKSLISYCDRSKFTGQVYTRLGMKWKRNTPPQAVWSKGCDKVTSMLLRQRGYDQLFNTSFGKGVSNEELMIENGWLPVYDCGQSVFILER